MVDAQPGAWFDHHGNLMVVGPGRRLRLVLSAPIAACSSAFQVNGPPADVSARASLPFHILNEACRNEHPAILLPEESVAASPAELEHSYHELARCAAGDWGLGEGWIPEVVDAADPCPLALGVGWRLPRVAELDGLSVDDRKAVAGALFDTDGSSAFGGLLLYARRANGELTLSTLSPDAAEVPSALADDKRSRPFFGAALRCVRDRNDQPPAQPFPSLPGATTCLRVQKQARALGPASPPLASPEVRRLQAWVALAQKDPAMLRTREDLKTLGDILAAPVLDAVARDARNERALTERYAELAEGLDDPGVSAAERDRRHAEFAHLRQRLGGQLVRTAEASSAQRPEFTALLPHLQSLLEEAAQAKPPKKGKALDYGALLNRLQELSGTAAAP